MSEIVQFQSYSLPAASGSRDQNDLSVNEIRYVKLVRFYKQDKSSARQEKAHSVLPARAKEGIELAQLLRQASFLS